jgi:hypothetical protein
MTAIPEPQTFEEAVTHFQDLLTKNGYSANLVWVEPGDLVLPGNRSIYVKLPIPTRNLARARDRFEHGMSNGLGVVFGTICELPNATPCYA